MNGQLLCCGLFLHDEDLKDVISVSLGTDTIPLGTSNLCRKPYQTSEPRSCENHAKQFQLLLIQLLVLLSLKLFGLVVWNATVQPSCQKTAFFGFLFQSVWMNHDETRVLEPRPPSGLSLTLACDVSPSSNSQHHYRSTVYQFGSQGGSCARSDGVPDTWKSENEKWAPKKRNQVARNEKDRLLIFGSLRLTWHDFLRFVWMTGLFTRLEHRSQADATNCL